MEVEKCRKTYGVPRDAAYDLLPLVMNMISSFKVKGNREVVKVIWWLESQCLDKRV